MTIKKAKKRLVRARMAKTGESYQRAEREVSSAVEGDRPTGATEPPAVGAVIAGRYRLLRIVPPRTSRLSGERGTRAPAILYDAVHVLLDKRIQVKLLPKSPETYLRAWMLREARAVERAAHPQVVHVFDIGETEAGELYLTFEEAPAMTLDEYIEARGERGQDDERARLVVGQLASILERVHERGVVHRGVRNGAVHVEERDGAPFVKLSSFSFASLASDPPLGRVNVSLGHAAWMSPEQCRGEEGDGRSDLYSLGVILYSMLAGRLPFEDASRERVLELQRLAAPPPLATRSALGAICMKLLAKDPAERYPDARALRDALGHAGPSSVEGHTM